MTSAGSNLQSYSSVKGLTMLELTFTDCQLEGYFVRHEPKIAASDSRENFPQYYMHNDICSRLKSLTTLHCAIGIITVKQLRILV